jgi:hypothetical protein
VPGDEIPYTHIYDAHAFALKGDLQLPIRAEIKPQASANLPREGGYLSQHACEYRLEGIISFRSAYTQVAGNLDTQKPDHGYVTLATAVLEDFNILDVVTVDRVVAQISTRHPAKGGVPTVTFLGTRFENLRIAGHPVHIELDTNILGERPGEKLPWSTSRSFRERVTAQYENIRHQSNLPAEIAERYNRLPSDPGSQESIECSLVHRADCSHLGRSFGHVIDIPHFGKLYLAVLRLKEKPPSETDCPKVDYPDTQFELTMIEAQMGCISSGNPSGPTTIVNGGTKGGG